MLVAKKPKAAQKQNEADNKVASKNKQRRLKQVSSAHHSWEMSAEEALRVNFVDREF